MATPLDDRPTSFQFGVPWEESAAYAQAVRRGSTVYVSGQLAHDGDGAFIGEGDIAAQTRATFANLDTVLAAFGATRADVVGVTVYVKDLRTHFDQVVELQAEYFGDLRPTTTLVGVSDLALPPQLVEVAAVAVLDA